MANPKRNLALKAENDRLESATAVLSSLRTHGEKLIRILSAESGNAESLVATVDPRIESMVSWLIERVTYIRDALQNGGRALRTSKSWRVVTSRRLGDGTEKIQTAIAGIADQFFSIYGVAASLDLGFSLTVPETGTALLEHVTYLYERLSNPLIALPEPAPGRLPVDVAAQLSLIKPFIAELQALVDTHEDQKRKTNDATVQKDDAVGLYDRDFSGLAASSQGMFRMAKMPRQARFVRPIRRRGVTVVAGQEPSDEPASDAGSPTEPVPAAEAIQVAETADAEESLEAEESAEAEASDDAPVPDATEAEPSATPSGGSQPVRATTVTATFAEEADTE